MRSKKVLSCLFSLLILIGISGCGEKAESTGHQESVRSTSIAESIADESSDYLADKSEQQSSEKSEESSSKASAVSSESNSQISKPDNQSSPEASPESSAPSLESSSENPSENSDIISNGNLTVKAVDPSTLPAYSGEPYVVVNYNDPVFPEITTMSYEYYSDLDYLGRCGMTIACIGKDLMPTEARGSIGMVKPTGWHTIKYDNVDGKYLYNRCHLIGFQLTAENANEKNLITGTRYLNVDGMLPFENMVADYIKETNNHVMYRSTPIFEGDNLVASGVQMEGYSVEDNGQGICFNVYCYNVQPGIIINYSDGSSTGSGLTEESKEESKPESSVYTEPSVVSEVSYEPVSQVPANTQTYILNTNTKKFHRPGCSSAKQIKDSNRQEYTGTREEVINKGYDPCKRCNP